MVMSQVVLTLWLLICSLQDIKCKKISTTLLLLGFPFLLTVSIVTNPIDFTSRILGFVAGVILIGISSITKGQIGIGDGLVISIIGLCLGIQIAVQIFMYGLFIAAIAAIIILGCKRGSRKTTMPFIPFLLLGYLGVLLL